MKPSPFDQGSACAVSTHRAGAVEVSGRHHTLALTSRVGCRRALICTITSCRRVEWQGRRRRAGLEASGGRRRRHQLARLKARWGYRHSDRHGRADQAERRVRRRPIIRPPQAHAPRQSDDHRMRRSSCRPVGCARAQARRGSGDPQRRRAGHARDTLDAGDALGGLAGPHRRPRPGRQPLCGPAAHRLRDHGPGRVPRAAGRLLRRSSLRPGCQGGHPTGRRRPHPQAAASGRSLRLRACTTWPPGLSTLSSRPRGWKHDTVRRPRPARPPWVCGFAPERRSYFSRATFRDPDGNTWLLQEVTNRLPGRVDPGPTPFPPTDLSSGLRAQPPPKANTKLIGQEEPDWPDRYAHYMVSEQTGTRPPE